MIKGFPVLKVLVACLILAACANRVPPGGGPIDKTAPVVKSSEPPNSSVNFTGKTISLTFDEYVQLKDGGTGIVISPPLQTPPKVTLKGHTVQLKFLEPLDSSATYTITIGKSVVDLAEGNPLEDYSFVFSTGPFLDSLNLSGAVKDAYTSQFVKDAYVLLYKTDEDSLVEKGLPSYFAKTNVQGNYTVRNIKQGSYKVVALLDANADYKYNQPEEKIGFRESMVTLDSVTNPGNDFRIFTAVPKTQKLLRKSYTLPGKLNIKYAIGLDSWQLTILHPADTFRLINDFLPGNDSINVWVSEIATDSLVFKSQSTVNGVVTTDTLLFNPQQIKKSGTFKKGGAKADTTLKLTSSIVSGKLRPSDTVAVYFSRPVTSVDTSRMFVLSGKDTSSLSAEKDFSSGAVSIKLSQLRKVPSFRLLFLPGAFTDMYGKTNDTTRINVGLYTEDELGLLEFTVVSDSLKSAVFIELTDKAGKPISKRSVKFGEKQVFTGLLPGSYGMRLIVDKDQNGKWTTGDFRGRIQPEKIIYFTGDITMRAGWDQELTWDLDAGAGGKFKAGK